MTETNQHMKALVLPEAGNEFALTQCTMPIPQLTGKQVLIKVEYVGLNPVDSKLASSGHPEWHFPHIPGLDGVGIVIDSYTQTCPLIGKRVMWHGDLTRQGAVTEYAVVEAHAVSIVPEAVLPEQAAAIPCAGMTALVSLCKLQLQAGETLLVDGGAGAVGQFAIQLAKQRDVTVYATASKKNHAYLKKLGADEVFDYRDPNLVCQLKKTMGLGSLSAVLDCIGGELTERNIELLHFGGRIACLNGIPDINQDLLFKRAPTVHVIALGGAWLSKNICAQHQLSIKGDHLLKDVMEKRLKLPEIHSVAFDSESVTQAMHAQLQGGVFGKQVVKVIE